MRYKEWVTVGSLVGFESSPRENDSLEAQAMAVKKHAMREPICNVLELVGFLFCIKALFCRGTDVPVPHHGE